MFVLAALSTEMARSFARCTREFHHDVAYHMKSVVPARMPGEHIQNQRLCGIIMVEIEDHYRY